MLKNLLPKLINYIIKEGDIMNEYIKDNLLIICPNEEKIKILDNLNKEDKLYDIKFMTKEEFKNNYYFSYNEKTLYYSRMDLYDRTLE